MALNETITATRNPNQKFGGIQTPKRSVGTPLEHSDSIFKLENISTSSSLTERFSNATVSNKSTGIGVELSDNSPLAFSSLTPHSERTSSRDDTSKRRLSYHGSPSSTPGSSPRFHESSYESKTNELARHGSFHRHSYSPTTPVRGHVPAGDSNIRKMFEELKYDSDVLTLLDTEQIMVSKGHLLSGKERAFKQAQRAKKLKKINRSHPEFELVYDMMLGIRTTVSRVEGGPFTELEDSDFTKVYKLLMPSEGSLFTPAHSMRDFKFKDYCPEVFRHLRARFMIDPADYLMCVCGNFSYLEFISNSKSGQFFFYSHDRQFMIKTITKQESKFLRTILSRYYQHIMSYPDTLLTRYYGMHRVKPHKANEVHFLDQLKEEWQLRLKGIHYGERDIVSDTIDEEKKDVYVDAYSDIESGYESSDPTGRGSFSEMSPSRTRHGTVTDSSGRPIIKRRQSHYGLKISNKVLNMLPPSDIPDYADIDMQGPEVTSLKIPNDRDSTIVRKERLSISQPTVSVFNQNFRENYYAGRSDSILKNHHFTSLENILPGVMGVDKDGKPTNDYYFFGIIDMLGEYTWFKKSEHTLKSLKYDPLAISAVEPSIYAERFVKFFEKRVE